MFSYCCFLCLLFNPLGEVEETHPKEKHNPIEARSKDALRCTITSLNWKGNKIDIKCTYEWVEDDWAFVYIRVIEQVRFEFWDSKGRRLPTSKDTFFLPDDFISKDVRSIELSFTAKVPERASVVALKMAGPGIMSNKKDLPRKK